MASGDGSGAIFDDFTQSTMATRRPYDILLAYRYRKDTVLRMQDKWIRRVALFLSGQTISLFGSMVVQFAISWHVTLTTKNGAQMMIMTLCGFLPQLVIAPFAGVWADRYDRKRMIVLADAMIALSTAALAVLFTRGYDHLWLLYVISAVRSLGSGVQQPAVSALLPDIVPSEHLMRINGINASIQSVMMLAAPAAAGVLYGTMGLQSTFWVDVATAVAGIGVMLALSVPTRAAQAAEHMSVTRDMMIGLGYVKRTRWLFQLILFYLAYALMFGPVVLLTPLMVARSFGDEAWRLSAHEMVFAVGSLIGGAALGFVGERVRNKMHLLLIGSAAFGLATFVMGFSRSFSFYLVVMGLMGITMPAINAGTMTVMQQKIAPEFMGRVFGLMSIVGSAAMPLSLMVFGPLADVVSVETQLIATGAVMVAIAAYMTRFPELIEAGEPLPAPEGGEAGAAPSPDGV